MMTLRFATIIPVLAAACIGGGIARVRAQIPASVAAPPEGRAVILYRDDIGLTAVAPAGWTLDDKQGRAIGALAVLYPKGETWANSDVVMYINVIRYAKGVPQTLTRAVADDVAETKQRTPKVRALQTGQGTTRDNRETATWTFDAGAPKPTCDAIIYQATPTGIVLIAVSARSPKAREAARAAWDSLANSVVYVRVEQKRGGAKPAPKL